MTAGPVGTATAGPSGGTGEDDGPPVTPPGKGRDDHASAVGRWRELSNKRNKKRPFWIELPILLVVAFVLTFLIQTFLAKVYYVPSGSMEKTLHGVPSGGDRILVSKVVYDFRDPKPGDIVVFKGPDSWDPEVNYTEPSWFGKIMQNLGSVVGVAPANEKDFVKRVIAVGGQTIACCDADGNITVDGTSIHEPYIFEDIPFTKGDASADCTVNTANPENFGGSSFHIPNGSRCFAPYTVPAGQLYVMGDHRSDSSDSSYLCRGLTAAGEAAYRATGGTDCNRPIPASDVIGKAIFVILPVSHWHTLGDPGIDVRAGAAPASSTAVPVAGGLVAVAGAGRIRRRRRRRYLGSARGHRSIGGPPSAGRGGS